MTYFTNFTATGSNASNGAFQDYENYSTGFTSWVQVLGTMNYTTGTGNIFFPGGPASVTSFDAQLSTQTGSDYLTIISGYSATWDGQQETVTTSGSNVYVNNVLVGTYGFSGQDLNFTFASASSNPDILGVLMQSVAFADAAGNRQGYNEQVSFSFGTSSGSVSAPTATVSVAASDIFTQTPAILTFTTSTPNTVAASYPNVPNTVMADADFDTIAGAQYRNGVHVNQDSYLALTSVEISIVNPQSGDQLLINPALIGDAQFFFDSATGQYILPDFAAAQIGNQGTTIHAATNAAIPFQIGWATELLDSIQYENTSGSAPSSVQISVSFGAVNDGSTYGDVLPATQYFTLNLTPLPSVHTEMANVTSGGSVAGSAGIAGNGALAGDSDANGYDLSISAVSGGSLGGAIHGTYGDLVLNADGSFTYSARATATEAANIAAANGPVTDAFTYSVSDGHGGVLSATLNIGADTTHPTIVATEFAFSGDQIKLGDAGTITLDMSAAMSVNTAGGSPTLTLNDGGIATFDAGKSTATSLVFDYQVGPDAKDVASLAINSVNLHDAIVQNVSNVADASFSLVGVTQAGPAIGPYVSTALAAPSIGTFVVGQTITLLVEMSAAVIVTGSTATLSLNNGGIATLDVADTAALSHLGLIAFDYKVLAEDGDVAALGITSVNLHDTTIIDGIGVGADFSGALPTFANIQIDTTQDTTPPALTPVANQTDEATGAAGAVAVFSATATDLVDGTDPVVFKEGNTVVHSGDTFALGTHTITASATDAAGNSSAETFTVAVHDTTPPVLTPVANQTDEATGAAGAVAVFSATATDLVDGTDPVVFKEGNTVVHSGDTFALGTHTITASATDAAGNSSAETFTVAVHDTTAPDTSIVSGPSSLTNSNQAAFTVSGIDAVGATGFKYKIDGGTWASTASSAIALTGLSDGSHVFQVAAFDAAGNVDVSPASFNWTVDTTAPTVSERLLTDTGTSSTDKITSNDVLTGSGDPNAVVHFTVDGVAIGATATASGTGAWSFTPTGISDGTHTIVASETDLAGNTGTSSLTFTLDTKAPQSEVTSIVQNGNGAKATVTFGGLSEIGSTILKIVESQIGGSVIGTDGDGSSTVLATTSAGGNWSATTGAGFSYSSSNDYKIDVTAKDIAGNVSTVSTFIGTAKADTLVGTSGNDFLYGSAKGDVLTGGAGTDTFVYKAIADSQPGAGNFDTITDFTHGSDKFDFSAIAGLNSNNQSVAINILTGNAPASIAAHTIDVVINGGSAVVYANASGLSETISNGHEDMQINLTGVTLMSASDFLLHL